MPSFTIVLVKFLFLNIEMFNFKIEEILVAIK